MLNNNSKKLTVSRGVPVILVSGIESLEHDEITGTLSLTSSTIIVSVALDDWSPIITSHN